MIWTAGGHPWHFQCDVENCPATFDADSLAIINDLVGTLREHGEAGWTKHRKSHGLPDRIYCPQHKPPPDPPVPLHHFKESA